MRSPGKGVGSPGASSGAPLVRAVDGGERRGTKETLFERQVASSHEAPIRGPARMRVPMDTRAPRDGNVDCGTRSPCSLSSSSLPSSSPNSARGTVYLHREPGFLLSVVSYARRFSASVNLVVSRGRAIYLSKFSSFFIFFTFFFLYINTN